jgi:hypothetical protein
MSRRIQQMRSWVLYEMDAHQQMPPQLGINELAGMIFGIGFISFGMRIFFNPLVFHKIQHEKSIQSITSSLDLAWEIIKFKPCRMAWQVSCTVVAMKLYHQLLRMSMKGMSSSYLA